MNGTLEITDEITCGLRYEGTSNGNAVSAADLPRYTLRVRPAMHDFGIRTREIRPEAAVTESPMRFEIDGLNGIASVSLPRIHRRGRQRAVPDLHAARTASRRHRGADGGAADDFRLRARHRGTRGPRADHDARPPRRRHPAAAARHRPRGRRGAHRAQHPPRRENRAHHDGALLPRRLAPAVGARRLRRPALDLRSEERTFRLDLPRCRAKAGFTTHIDIEEPIHASFEVPAEVARIDLAEVADARTEATRC